jgi:hypothetical protein
MKFPSQSNILYAGATVANGTFASTHKINIPKDISILNRRGYASTTKKGVPLVYRVAATIYPGPLDGSGYTTSVSSDIRTTVKFLGCQNNWVMKNAAVKLHAAREKWLKKTGVSKKLRGAYSHEIRYAYEASGETFAAPVDGNGAAFTGGTWDITTFADDLDNSYNVKLVGASNDESSATTDTAFSLPGLYLNSRGNQLADTNPEADDTPARYSHLQFLMGNLSVDEQQDVAIGNIQGEQDNPPYDTWAVDDVNNDITEEVELGRVNMYPHGSGGSLPQTVELEVPFGIMEVLMAHRDPGDNSGVTDALGISIEVLGIYEMQG